MNKSVLLIGFERVYHRADSNAIVKRLVKRGDVPIFPATVIAENMTPKEIQALNIALKITVDSVDQIYVHNDYSAHSVADAYCDVIGYAVLRGKEIILSNPVATKITCPKRPAEALAAALSESTITDATED